ncbi:MAG: hypothetical protein V7629_10695 [Motiliproteus sp.]
MQCLYDSLNGRLVRRVANDDSEGTRLSLALNFGFRSMSAGAGSQRLLLIYTSLGSSALIPNGA